MDRVRIAAETGEGDDSYDMLCFYLSSRFILSHPAYMALGIA
jgi:hypothetical protein